MHFDDEDCEEVLTAGRTRLLKTPTGGLRLRRWDGGRWLAYHDSDVVLMLSQALDRIDAADRRAEAAELRTEAAETEARDEYSRTVSTEAALEHAEQRIRDLEAERDELRAKVGLQDRSDEEVAAEFVRRFGVLQVKIGKDWDSIVTTAHEWNGWHSGVERVDDWVLNHARHDGPASAILRAARLARGE